MQDLASHDVRGDRPVGRAVDVDQCVVEAAGFTTPEASPVPRTPVGRTIVTLIFPCDSTRRESDRTATAALVAL